MDSSAVEGFLDIVSVVITKSLGFVSTVISTIEEEPLLLTVVLIPFVSIGVSILKKLLTVKS